MADIAPSDMSGTSPVIGPTILGGKRRKFYLQDEDLAVISRDKFDMLESAVSDRGLFSHLAVGFLSAAAPLSIEMGIHWWIIKDKVSAITAVVGVTAILLGVFFAVLVWIKSQKVNKVRVSLFADQNLVDDRTILEAADGTSIQIVHLSPSASGEPQSNQNTVTGTLP
ncbi:MAG: hypothetical protein RLN85_02150 [Pseudomonadales bacterium]